MKKHIGVAFRIAVSIVLIAFLIRKASFGSIAHSVRAADPGWLAAGLALGMLAGAQQAYQWRGLLAAMGLRRRYLSTLKLDTAARVFDAALPTSIGGDVVRIGLAARTRTDRIPAALSVVLRRLMQLPGLVVVLLAGLALSWNLSYVGRVQGPAIAFVLAGVGLIAIIGVASRFKPLEHVRVPAKVRRLPAEWTLARAASVGGNRPLAHAAVRGLLFWIVVVLSQACYMRAVGIHAPVGYATVVIATVNALSLLPISLGGYGLREGTFSAFLTAGGLATTAQGAAVGAILSIQTLLFGLVGGLVYLTMRRGDHLPKHASDLGFRPVGGTA